MILHALKANYVAAKVPRGRQLEPGLGTPALTSFPARLHVFNSSIHRCQRRQHNEKESVCSSVQREIKKAMDEHSKTSCQSPSGHTSPEVITRLPSRESHSK